jgi:hypothetical protein
LVLVGLAELRQVAQVAPVALEEYLHLVQYYHLAVVVEAGLILAQGQMAHREVVVVEVVLHPEEQEIHHQQLQPKAQMAELQ